MAKPGKIQVNANGNAVRHKMHVKTGDTVQVISGRDKGKVGKICHLLDNTKKPDGWCV